MVWGPVKSPEQYLSIDAFYKVLGYACFYKSDVQHVDTIKVDGITIDLKKKEETDRLFEEYEKNSNSNLHKSIMDLVVRANQKVFEEASGNMCDALRELFSKEIDEAVTEGLEKGYTAKLIEQISKKLAKGKSVEQIADDLEETVETIQELMKTLN